MRINATGVYRITNIVTNQHYIGKARNIARRWKTHVRLLMSGEHHSKKLQDSWNQYGKDAFEFVVLLNCDFLSAANYEKIFANILFTHLQGFNVAGIGESKDAVPVGYVFESDFIEKDPDEVKPKRGEYAKEIKKLKGKVYKAEQIAAYWQRISDLYKAQVEEEITINSKLKFLNMENEHRFKCYLTYLEIKYSINMEEAERNFERIWRSVAPPKE